MSVTTNDILEQATLLEPQLAALKRRTDLMTTFNQVAAAAPIVGIALITAFRNTIPLNYAIVAETLIPMATLQVSRCGGKDPSGKTSKISGIMRISRHALLHWDF